MAEQGKSFIKNFIGFSMVTWMSFALSFFTAPISTRLFAPDVLGKINIFNTYSSLMGIFVLVGLDQAFARFYLERPNNRSLGYLFTFCFSIGYSILFVGIITALPFSEFLSWQFFEEKDNLLLYLFFFSVFCQSTLRYLNLSYRMEKNMKMYTIQGILMTLVSKVLYLGVGFWDPSYKPALIVLTVSHFTLAFVFLIIQCNRFERIRVLDKVFAKEMFKYALPLVPVSVLFWANSSIPQLVLQKTMDYHSIGIYTSAVALANVINIIQSGFNIYWLPYTYENYKTQTGQFYKVHRMLLCALTLFALLLILSQDVVFLLLGEKYRAAKTFFPFLILGPTCYIVGETTGLGIDLSKKTYFNLVVFTCSVATNIILCVFFQKWLGVPGVAIATASAAIVALILKTIFGEKQYHVVDSYSGMIFTLLAIISCAVVTLTTPQIGLRSLLVGSVLIIACIFYRKEIIYLWNVASSFVKDKRK